EISFSWVILVVLICWKKPQDWSELRKKEPNRCTNLSSALPNYRSMCRYGRHMEQVPLVAKHWEQYQVLLLVTRKSVTGRFNIRMMKPDLLNTCWKGSPNRQNILR